MTRALITATCLAGLVAGASPALAKKYRGSEDELAARKAGRAVVKELDLDLDADGTRETAVVERLSGGRLVARVLRFEGDPEEGRFIEVVAGTPRKAKKVARFEARPMVGGPAPELVVVLEDPSPDEVAVTVRVIGATDAGIQELFADTFLVPPQAREDAPRIAFGDATPHLVFSDVRGGDGQEEVVWVSGPQSLALPGRNGPVSFTIGAYRTVYAYEAAKGRFEKVAEREVEDFAGAKAVTEAKASAQVPKIWGTAQPFWGADADLETSWNVPAGEAAGQTLTVHLKGSPEVRMIRVVPGCGASETDWRRHHRLEKFRVVLGSGVRFDVDRADLEALPAAVEAMGEFPLEEGFGAQVLVALKRPVSVPWARLEIVGLEKPDLPKGQRAEEACLSEISFH
jgi:hypothetical protein